MAVPATEAERQNACLKCLKRRQEIHGGPQNDQTVDLQDLVETSDFHLSAQILDAFQLNPSTDFEWDGYPLGTFWSYETVLRFKSHRRHHGRTRRSRARCTCRREALDAGPLVVRSGPRGIARPR